MLEHHTDDVTATGQPTQAPPEGPPAKGYSMDVPDRPNGPVVRALLQRTGRVAALAGGASVAALAVSKRPGTKAALLGALVPGGGYAYSRNPWRLAATAGAFAVSLATWFATGNILAPPAIWLGSALDARRQTRHGKNWEPATVVVPAVVGAALVAGTVARRQAFRQAQERGRVRAEYLRTSPRVDVPAVKRPVEMSTEDLATLRWFVNRSLQPRDSFDGYDIVEQFQTSAIRYQIFMAGWVLAASQLTRTPAFRGYVSAAQRALIDKVTHKRVWGYWRFEQAWGNLSLDWDPMARDNIMLSGYYGNMLGFYESNTGDDRYRVPGSLPFVINRRRWDYDFDKLAEAVHANMKRSRMTLFPCEPNWIYSMCNMTGINTLLLSDRLHGTAYDASVGDDLRRRLREEFVTPDGRITAIRSARLGITIPMLTSTLADTTAATMMHAADPELARRTWTIVRNEFVDISGDIPSIALRGWDAIDTGNYQRGDVNAFAAVMWAAAEMGDSEVYDALLPHVESTFGPTESDGARWYRGGSNQANSLYALARFSLPGTFRRLVAEGPGRAVLEGPYLEAVNYPEVLVAFADTDGSDLRLVLHPGGADVGRQRLGIEQLRPGTTYRVSGAAVDEIVADARGRAALEVDVDARREVHLTPTA
jgi:Linalool dehydratase/isomerase